MNVSEFVLSHEHQSWCLSYPESMDFHFLSSRDFAVIKMPMTALHSLPFSCSVMLVSRRCLLFHRSSSDNGPAFGSMNL